MHIHLHPDQQVLGETAGKEAAALIRTKLASHDSVNLILGSDPALATTLQTLCKAPGINWGKVAVYQLTEFIGVSGNHKASHRKFLQEHFLSKVTNLKKAFLINGETILSDELKRLNSSLQETHMDIAIVGIGEHAEIGFNSAPANLKAETPYVLVETSMNEARSMVAAGLYRTLNEVPQRAFTMSLHQLLRVKHIICPVAGGQRSAAISTLVNGEEDDRSPAGSLKKHAGFSLHLDQEAAALLPEKGK